MTATFVALVVFAAFGLTSEVWAQWNMADPNLADSGLSDSTAYDILVTLMNWLLAILGFIAIIAFVISGMQYLTAAGDEGLAERAKSNLKYSIIGIIVALSGYIIIVTISDVFLSA